MKCKAACDEITHVFQIKTFVLKFLVGKRFKGWTLQPSLSVYSSVIKHLALAYMPCSLQRCLIHGTTN